jgi:hypothetical protein
MRKILFFLLILVLTSCSKMEGSSTTAITGGAVSGLQPAVQNSETQTEPIESSAQRDPKVDEFFSELEKTLPLNTMNFSEYRSPKYKIRIIYPEEWTMLDLPTDTVVDFLAPLENEDDTFQENLNVVVQDVGDKPLSLYEYAEISIAQINDMFEDSKILSVEDTTLDGNSAHRLIHTAKYGEYELKWMQIYTIKNRKVYLITYTAEREKYDAYLDIILDMVDSFRILS